MTNRILLLVVSLFFSGLAGASYYDSKAKYELEHGNLKDRDLLRFVGTVAHKGFKPLGYKKRAKPELFGFVHLEKDSQGYFVYDVYCGFKIRNSVGPKRIPKNSVMNTEHTWPQSKGSKREPARGDLHHLYPTDSRANSARGNHPFGEVAKGKDATNKCPLSQRGKLANPRTGKPTGTYGFQPPHEHRGNVARAMFYVAAKYSYKLSEIEEFYLRKWHKEDPVDREEIKRNDRVQEAQGNRNPFVDYPELANRVSDF